MREEHAGTESCELHWKALPVDCIAGKEESKPSPRLQVMKETEFCFPKSSKRISALRDIKFMGARHYHVEVTVGHLRGSGIAKIKKAAKQGAARVLLQKLEGDPRFIGGACRLDKSEDTTWIGKSVNKQKNDRSDEEKI